MVKNYPLHNGMELCKEKGKRQEAFIVAQA